MPKLEIKSEPITIYTATVTNTGDKPGFKNNSVIGNMLTNPSTMDTKPLSLLNLPVEDMNQATGNNLASLNNTAGIVHHELKTSGQLKFMSNDSAMMSNSSISLSNFSESVPTTTFSGVLDNFAGVSTPSVASSVSRQESLEQSISDEDTDPATGKRPLSR